MSAARVTNVKQRLRARRDDERGSILPIAVVGLILAVIAAALSIDLGRLAQDKRHDQKAADLAALDAVRCLPSYAAANNCTLDYLATAQASATRNGFDLTASGASFAVTPGNITGYTFTPGPAATANAVKVQVTSVLNNVFVSGGHTLVLTGLASMGTPSGHSDGTPLGTVRVGSTLASASSTDSVLLNRLLTNTVGGSYSLGLVGWQGIAAGNVRLDRLRTALGYATGSPDSVLDANLTMRQLLDASVNALNADGSPSSLTAATYLAQIAAQVSANAGAQFHLRKLLDIVGNVGDGTDVADATINVLDVVRGSMALADTDHFASFDMTAGDLPLVPGLTKATVKFGLIEAPQTKSGPPGKDSSGTYRTTASTAQIRLSVEENLNVSLLGLGIVAVKVPYYFDAGRADASLDNMACTGNDVPASVGILGTTRVGTVQIGAVADASLGQSTPPSVGTTRLLTALLGTVWIDTSGPVVQNIPGNGGQLLNFAPVYSATTSQPIPGVNTLSLPPLAAANLTVHVVGLGLNAGTITSQLLTAVTSAVQPLTDGLVKPLLRSLGLSFAGADVWAPPPQKCSPVQFNIGNSAIPTLIG